MRSSRVKLLLHERSRLVTSGLSAWSAEAHLRRGTEELATNVELGRLTGQQQECKALGV